MRAVFVAAALAAPFVSGILPAQSQQMPPWCLKAAMGEDWVVDLCYYYTFESCNQERFNYGPKSSCIVNPHYYFRYGEPDQTPRRLRRTPR
jgi:hypothetical protein